MFERLKFRPQQLAIIYVKTNLDPTSPCFPGHACVEIREAATVE